MGHVRPLLSPKTQPTLLNQEPRATALVLAGYFSVIAECRCMEQPTPNASLASFFSPELAADPYPTYRALREQNPVFKVPDMQMWLLTRYRDMTSVLRDKRFGHSRDPGVSAVTQQPYTESHPAVSSLQNMMLLANPPEHTRLRALVVKAFNARSVESMRAKIRDIANELLDPMVRVDGGDLVRLFNHQLPVIVICEMLGIPKEDQLRFRENQYSNGRLIDPTPLTDKEIEDADNRTLDMEAYLEHLFELRRREPQDDLLTALVESETEHGKLSRAELTANVSLLFAAGHETTANLLGNALLAVYRNPKQLQLLRANPKLMPAAVEEFLRYDSSVQLTGRVAMEDVEYEGHLIQEGQQVLTLIGAANHDPEQFERPDELDICRKDAKYLSFGGGIHFCLGAQLARIEAAEALTLLFERLPKLRLQNIETPSWKQTITLRGLTNLPASW